MDYLDLINNIELLYNLTIISNICDKAEIDVEKVVKIFLDRRKTNWQAIKDLPESLLEPNWAQIKI